MAARIATATAIANRLEADAKARGRANGWRRTTLDSLLALSLPALQRVEGQAFSADALPATIANVADCPQLIGDTDEDLVYFPIAPCRYADTRNVGGPINGVRGYDVANNGATYGGDPGCAPTTLFGADENSFGALALNVTALNPAVAPGFVAVKPTAASPVTSLLNWYETAASKSRIRGL